MRPAQGQAAPRAITTARTLVDSYSLKLRGIRFEANVGASAKERAVPQELVVDLDMTLPIDALPKRDRLKEVVSYDDVASCVVEIGTAETYRLVETYAGRVVAALFARFRATTVRVAVTKKRVPTKYPVEQAIIELVAQRP